MEVEDKLSLGLTYTQYYKKKKKKKVNEDLEHSTGNYIQFPIITYNGKDSEAVHLKLTQYCKSNIVQFFKKERSMH